MRKPPRRASRLGFPIMLALVIAYGFTIARRKAQAKAAVPTSGYEIYGATRSF